VGCYRATVRLLIHFHERRAHRLFVVPHAVLKLPGILWQFLSDDACPSRNISVRGAFKKHGLTNLEFVTRHGVPPRKPKSPGSDPLASSYSIDDTASTHRRDSARASIAQRRATTISHRRL
jgi:hypothetical protein